MAVVWINQFWANFALIFWKLRLPRVFEENFAQCEGWWYSSKILGTGGWLLATTSTVCLRYRYINVDMQKLGDNSTSTLDVCFPKEIFIIQFLHLCFQVQTTYLKYTFFSDWRFLEMQKRRISFSPENLYFFIITHQIHGTMVKSLKKLKLCHFHIACRYVCERMWLSIPTPKSHCVFQIKSRGGNVEFYH